VTTPLRAVRPLRAILAAAACLALVTPAAALDLNAFRREHHLPPLHVSSAMAGAASAHAHDLAARQHLDHDGFRSRLARSTMAAENVAYGCGTQDCVIRMWARSPGHRRNMLMKGVTHYGLASARGANGQTYWVLEMGN
jgi:uncharacterized protein YkwD